MPIVQRNPDSKASKVGTQYIVTVDMATAVNFSRGRMPYIFWKQMEG
jgi:hypothetical protein